MKFPQAVGSSCRKTASYCYALQETSFVMLFTFLMTTAVCNSVALRPEVTGYQSSSISKLGAEVARAERFEGAEGLSALQSAASIVNSIMLQAGNITEHMTDDDKTLLESIEPMIEQSIYGSMDSSHEADVASIQAALDAINQCNTDIAARLGVLGDLNKLQFEVVDFQDALNDLQDDVDAKTQANSTKFDELQKHIDNIGAAPDCEAFPSNPTKLKVDNFFTGSLHVNWYTAQQEAYAPFADAVEVADGELGAALTAYAVGLAERNVGYCDWKVELEGGCEVFNQCYQSKTAKYLSELKPALQGDMQIRIDGYKAGQTIIAQIKFLLGETTDSTLPSNVDATRYVLEFPQVPAQGSCSLEDLDSPKWDPAVQCAGEELECPDLVFGTFGNLDGCPTGYTVVDDVDSCGEAATHLGFNYRGPGSWPRDYPKCFVQPSSKDVWFNNHPNPNGSWAPRSAGQLCIAVRCLAAPGSSGE